MASETLRVLITGAGSGIGRELAIEAARRGYLLALCGRRTFALEETASLAGAIDALILTGDVSSASGRQNIAGGVSSAFGGLDILINNAGIVPGGALSQMSDDDVAQTFGTNVVGPILLTRDLLPLLTGHGPSRIVNIGSVFGDIPYPGFATYSASKFALRGFSDALRRELKVRNISVTYVAPRATRTAAASAFATLIAQSGMRLDDPKIVARYIWKRIDSGQDRIYPPGAERFYVLLERLFPSMISSALARQAG